MSQGTERSPEGVLEASAVTHRFTHDDDLPEPRELLILLAALATERLGGAGGDSALLSAVLGRAVGDKPPPPDEQADAAAEEESPECPSPDGEIEHGSENTFLGEEQLPVALVDMEDEDCENHRAKPLRKGCADVWVNQKPLARRTDETGCGARLGEGEPTVLIGATEQICSMVEVDAAPQHLQRSLEGILCALGGLGELGEEAAQRLGASIAGLSGVGASMSTKAELERALSAVAGSELGKKLTSADFDALLAGVLGGQKPDQG